MAGPLTYALVGLLSVFAIGDAIAHLTHYRYGATVSKAELVFFKKHPIAHVMEGLALAYLWGHLIFGWPLG